MLRHSRKHSPIKIIAASLAFLLVFYLILVNILVSAALEPAFMEKLTLFDTISAKSLDEQVYTDDINKHISDSLATLDDWLAGIPMSTETIESGDGLQLVAARMDVEEPSHLWCLMLHGYTGWKEEMYSYARLYYNRGFNCLIPDLRAQGESEGRYIGMGWTDHYDCMLWIDRILEIDPDAEIVIHGQSMGASTALIMTGEEELSDHVKAVVSDCAYTDAYSMFAYKLKDWFHLPAFPILDTAVFFFKLRGSGYDLRDASALEAVKTSQIPTIFIHGTEDHMIPVEMVYELYNAETADKELLVVEGAGHAQANPKDPITYNREVFSFIAQYMDGYTYE